MSINLEYIDLYPTPHPAATVERAGFPLDHAYIEQCWGPIVGPSSVALLRHCVWLWQDAVPARVHARDLAAEIGLGRGTTANGPLWHTMTRLERFHLVSLAESGSEVRVYTQVPPLGSRQLDRLSAWSRSRHERLLDQHLDALAAGGRPAELPVHVRMTERLDRLATSATATSRTIGR